MAQGCSRCNGGLGYAPFLFDAPEEELGGVQPYVQLPAVAEPSPVNRTADLVVAALGAQTPTGGDIQSVSVVDDSIKVAVGTTLTAKEGGALYFSDDAQPYKPVVVQPVAAEEPAPQSERRLVKYAAAGLVGYFAWKLLGR